MEVYAGKGNKNVCTCYVHLTLINNIFSFVLVDGDDVPEGDIEDNNEDEDNAVLPVPVTANNLVNFQLDAD